MTEQSVVATETGDCYHANEDCPLFLSGRRVGASGILSPTIEMSLTWAAQYYRPCKHCIGAQHSSG